jgi:hypothetical protein
MRLKQKSKHLYRYFSEITDFDLCRREVYKLLQTAYSNAGSEVTENVQMIYQDKVNVEDIKFLRSYIINSDDMYLRYHLSNKSLSYKYFRKARLASAFLRYYEASNKDELYESVYESLFSVENYEIIEKCFLGK